MKRVRGRLSGYRYGFNGKENDNEVKGEGGQQDYGMRVYDPRIGKFLSVDPLTKEYPWNSSYAYAENDVIRSADLDGAEKDVRTFSYYLSDNKPSVKITSDNYVQPQGTSNIGAWLGLRPQTAKERVARGLVSSYHLPNNGTLSFFEFGAGIDKENYARYDYDIGGKQYTRYFDAGNIAFMYNYYGLEDKTAAKILNVAAASANLVAAGALVKGELQAAKGEIAGASRNLNPTGGDMNCANCTFAGDLTLKGMPATATNVLLFPTKGVKVSRFFEAWGGAKDVTLHYSPNSIIKAMNGMSEGATGVIFGARESGVGHFFNVAKQNGVVQFIDFQLGVGQRAINPSTLMQSYKFDHLLFKNTTGITPNQIKW